MLLDNFFSIVSVTHNAGIIKATLQINGQHPIFDGHFPGQPVVPGVCMMQMLKEITEQVIGKQTRMTSAAEMKFLAVINPVENDVVNAEIKYNEADDGSIFIFASLISDTATHFKCKSILSIAGN